jgi:hypothetical protein
MSGSFMRQVNDALMPEGAVWTPEYGGYYDRFLDGCADNAQRAFDDLNTLAFIRDPRRVLRELLPDLEREYGISSDDAIPETDRRAELAVERYGGRRLALVVRLQAALDRAGFGSGGYGLIVTPNATPAIDPGSIIGDSFALSAHDFPIRHCAGNAIAYAGQAGGGYYLVSGDRFYAVRAGKHGDVNPACFHRSTVREIVITPARTP